MEVTQCPAKFAIVISSYSYNVLTVYATKRSRKTKQIADSIKLMLCFVVAESTGCGIKNNPLRKLEFLENDQAYFAVFFIG